MNRIGSASSPRWYRGTVSGLSAYLTSLTAWGAGAAELVLHHGPASEHVRYVHVIQQDWNATFAQYHAREIDCHAHTSVLPGFRLEGWLSDAAFMRAQYLPLLTFCARMAHAQGRSVTIVVHGAGDIRTSLQANQDATRGFLAWAESVILVLGDTSGYHGGGGDVR